jgi:hypothetical protein
LRNKAVDCLQLSRGDRVLEIGCGNPLIQPWTEIVALTEHFNMREYLFASYYICCGMKPSVGDTATECEGASRDNANMDDAYRITAE